MDPTAASSNCDGIKSAVFISAERRGARPGNRADGEYTGIGFMTVMMTAADQHEEANAQRDEAENPEFDGANAANSVPVVGEFDLSEFAVELEAVVGGASDSEGEDSDGDDGAAAYGADPPDRAAIPRVGAPLSGAGKRISFQARRINFRACARKKKCWGVFRVLGCVFAFFWGGGRFFCGVFALCGYSCIYFARSATFLGDFFPIFS